MKSILLTLLFIPVLVLCQNYQFDHLLTYKVTRIKPSIESFGESKIYINSEQPKYSMDTFITNDNRVNWLKDPSNRLHYKFNVVEREKDGDLYYYEYAKRFIKEDERHFRFIERVEVEKINDLSYIVKAYHKKKKISFVIRIELEKSDVNLMNFHLLDVPEFTEEKIFTEFRKVLPNENFVIKKIKTDRRNGYVFSEELIDIKNLKKQVNLPKEIEKMVSKQFENYKD
ncbi:hypothetical protein MQX03_07825 [Chryseobacterium aahli]|uniref:hypothetical protein n=1 Tax=Chryseobacterium aahli TaxID=1278643 RepID=UPI001F61F369|nr:hypothetical protein [Chryseobacterium aahli]MCI3937104.1 hypothetical protein [Chryseobacterium aahli]